jgi:hypothetical protein
VVSGLRFEDESCEVLLDEGSATGALNDAVLQFWFGSEAPLHSSEAE